MEEPVAMFSATDISVAAAAPITQARPHPLLAPSNRRTEILGSLLHSPLTSNT